MGTCTVEQYVEQQDQGSWSPLQEWLNDLWWVPNGTYLWPLNGRVYNTSTSSYWWNFWTPSPVNSTKGVLHLRASAKLGWMETWDIASIALVRVEERMKEEPINRGFTWASGNDPCTGQNAIFLMGGRDGNPARKVVTEVEGVHPWKDDPDNFLKEIANQQHRRQIQVGVVQSVESFQKGKFKYTSYAGNGELWGYLPYDPPPGIPRGDQRSQPPLLDTINCPGDAIQHAWYADRGAPQQFESGKHRVWSYALLGENHDNNEWRAWIGYTDSPAFGVPYLYLDGQWWYQLEQSQTETPTLFFYDAIAARTWFFPYSYVPVIRLKPWRINFNGTVMFFDGTRQQGWYKGDGAVEGDTTTMTTPETAYGPYNSFIQTRWLRR